MRSRTGIHNGACSLGAEQSKRFQLIPTEAPLPEEFIENARSAPVDMHRKSPQQHPSNAGITDVVTHPWTGEEIS